MLRRLFLVLSLVFVPMAGAAQTLTPEQIAAMVDQRVNTLNPYAALLNDPDPQRSLAALQIMLESDDPTLTRLALEFGVLSPNPTVRRTAVEAFMASGPRLEVRLDGTGIEESRYPDVVRSNFNGLVDSQGVGVFNIQVGAFDPNARCFIELGRSNCLITVSNSGVFLSYHLGSSSPYMTASMSLNDVGQLSGVANLSRIESPIPIMVQLID